MSRGTIEFIVVVIVFGYLIYIGLKYPGRIESKRHKGVDRVE